MFFRIKKNDKTHLMVYLITYVLTVYSFVISALLSEINRNNSVYFHLRYMPHE